MVYIHHRINTVQKLNKVPFSRGIEVDIRYHENDLILCHDPFSHHQNNPERFEEILKIWQHEGPIILNIKTEGIEQACIDLINQYKIKNWFFLDLSMPCFAIYAERAVHRGVKGFSLENLAVRFSEWEPIEYALSFSGKARWAWVDCFTHLPINKSICKKLKNAGYKICLVSPELQNHPITQIEVFKKQIKGCEVNAVCTEFPDLWK